jgi:drug/metabolite transporter (DMT)-like permease
MTDQRIFMACVTIWGSTWIAITFQLGRVAPEASVCYRFLLASLLIFAYCLVRGLPLRFTLREHAWMALFGAFMFSVSYIFVYYAEQHVVSGLVAVGYSASPLLGMVGLWVFFRTPMTLSVGAGAVLGIVGIALVFLPEFGHVKPGGNPVWGALCTLVAVTASAVGSLVAHRNQEARLPLWQMMGWGMLYGSALSFLVTLALGRPIDFELAPGYVLSLLYLAVFGSIIAFAGFLTLIQRIGAARAGYVGVMVPIVALVISSAFEAFRWQPLTWGGIAVSVAGNVVILRVRRAAAPAR